MGAPDLLEGACRGGILRTRIACLGRGSLALVAGDYAARECVPGGLQHATKETPK